MASIRLAMAGKGAGQWGELADRLLPVERKMVEQAIKEAGK
jgi:hypothetical protein